MANLGSNNASSLKLHSLVSPLPLAYSHQHMLLLGLASLALRGLRCFQPDLCLAGIPVTLPFRWTARVDHSVEALSCFNVHESELQNAVPRRVPPVSGRIESEKAEFAIQRCDHVLFCCRGRLDYSRATHWSRQGLSSGRPCMSVARESLSS